MEKNQKLNRDLECGVITMYAMDVVYIIEFLKDLTLASVYTSSFVHLFYQKIKADVDFKTMHLFR